MHKIVTFAAIAMAFLLAGCETPGQTTFNYTEVGQSVLVDFGTVVDVTPIKIKGPNTGTGALLGGTAGAVAGSNVGNGNGQVAGAVGGLVVGAVAGAMIEQSLQDQMGFLYTVVLENGKTVTVSQYQKKEDVVFQKGARVMVQSSGSYQRVLPADQLPTEIKRPKGIKVVD